jgi:methyl-accepting chemotaxis protein
MKDETIEIVQRTWTDVEAIAPAAAVLFYDNLFARDPSLRPMFRGDIESQGKKLMQALALAVRALRDLDSLVPVLQSLGRRHVGYGVLPAHYDTVGAALLETLGQGLGDAFTSGVERAWAEVYGLVAGVMIEAAEEDVRLSA